MGTATDNWYLSGTLHIESESSDRPDKDSWQEHFGHTNIWGKFTKIATDKMWGLQNSYGLLQNWDTDSLFIGLKDEGSNRKDAVIAFGDDADESLRFLFTGAGFPPLPPKELLRITGSGNVGIGATNPTHPLHVKADWGFLALDSNVAGQDSGLRLMEGGAVKWHMWNSARDTKLYFARDGLNPTFVLDQNGNVDIGLNPLRMSSGWTGSPDGVTNRAEISNDTRDHKTLMIIGNKSAGMGRRVSVWDRLEVNGDFTVTNLTEIGSNPLRFSSTWTGSPDGATNRAEISNDTGDHKTLMIIGNKSAGMGRRVSVWDRLEVNGTLTVSNSFQLGNGAVFNRFQTGTTSLGSNDVDNGSVSFSISFPQPFSEIPKVIATARDMESHGDVFVVSTKGINTNGFSINVRRLDTWPVNKWGMDLHLDWFAWT